MTISGVVLDQIDLAHFMLDEASSNGGDVQATKGPAISEQEFTLVSDNGEVDAGVVVLSLAFTPSKVRDHLHQGLHPPRARGPRCPHSQQLTHCSQDLLASTRS